MLSIQIPDFIFSDPTKSNETFQEYSWDDVDTNVDVIEAPIIEPKPSPSLAMYDIGVEIGEGKTSLVYKADSAIHGKVALKVYHKKYMYNFDHEVSFIKKLNEYNGFVHVYETWKENDRGYIAMELMDGTLFDLIERGMPFDLIMPCVEQVIHGLAVLHSNDMIHFDMKPENIGYKYRGGKYTFTIMDFGTAETFEYVNADLFQARINSKKLIISTINYRSYEGLVLTGQRHSEKSDIWVVGVLIFEMVTGNQLFNLLHPDDCDECDDNCAAANHDSITKKIQFGLKKVRKMVEGRDDSELIQSIMRYSLDTNVEERYSATELLQLITW
jgi:serine/threonine protein kinase